MHIDFVEISNFRKLKSVRVELASRTTLFVGANNSGKTSAMLAFRKFLSTRSKSFEIHDFTLSNWELLNAIGDEWRDARSAGSTIDLDLAKWASLLPTFDLWVHVGEGELHLVRDLMPDIDWQGGRLGLRLRFQPKDLTVLHKAFTEAVESAQEILEEAKKQAVQADGADLPPPTVWPTCMVDFLSRRLPQLFELRGYPLDPSQVVDPVAMLAQPQVLPEGSLPLEGDPIAGLIRVNEIPAHRGFGEQEGDADGTGKSTARLSDQLRMYYAKHLDPTDRPEPSDLNALQAIEAAQKAFDERLTESFKAAFAEVEGMGYPGVTDPRPRVSTRLKATDGLNHAAAVSFEVDVVGGDAFTNQLLKLPEDSNGLGYQNLISMIFRLMSFRDGWMRTGKAGRSTDLDQIEPLHLVLVEEPEAHLHAQVQQVFIRKAYEVLRASSSLGSSEELRTQLVVSTHSSHVAHEAPFSWLRYFRRLPAGMVASVPVSTVINLTNVFGSDEETDRFVTRYLRAQHADLFFADAALLVEGPAERMLIPNFISAKHAFLSQCYLTLLEIGGSHAHKLQGLIETLGLLTVVIADIDSLDHEGEAVEPRPKAGLRTNNATLKTWAPKRELVDDLYAADDQQRTVTRDNDPLFGVRVGFQQPINVVVPKTSSVDVAYPYTFEDALVFQNIEYFKDLAGKGLIAKFRSAVNDSDTAAEMGKAMFKALRSGKKAEFALDLIEQQAFDQIAVPEYIATELTWLEDQLRRKRIDVMDEVKSDLPVEPSSPIDVGPTGMAAQADGGIE